MIPTWRLRLLVVLAGMALPSSALAWGFDVHRFIVARAMERLPDDLRPFFKADGSFVIEHSVDPDLWRTAGFADEPPRHYLDLDAYGTHPFAELPRDFDRAVARFGAEEVRRNGTLPWRTEEMYQRLVDAFRRSAPGGSRYGRDDVKFMAAVISHYASDAFVPFHAVINYDGQLTGQRGIHARFETELFLRFRDRIDVVPPTRGSSKEPRTLVFDALLEGTRLVPDLLQADRRAAGGGRTYDDQYYSRFLASVRPILERRLAESIAAVASLITGAWEQAGRVRMQ